MKTSLLGVFFLRKLYTRESRQANEFRLVTSETKQQENTPRKPRPKPSQLQISGQTKHLKPYDGNDSGTGMHKTLRVNVHLLINIVIINL